LYSDMEHRVF